MAGFDSRLLLSQSGYRVNVFLIEKSSSWGRTILAVKSGWVRLLFAAPALALCCGACTSTPDRSDLVPIGGPWYFHLESHLPEAGWVPTDLYRDWKGKPVLVAKNIEDHKYYESDCVVFVTGHATPTYIAYAACGDRLPAAIDVRDHRHWRLDPDGLRHEESARVAAGVPVKPTQFIPLDSIRAVALGQPPFDPLWRPGGRGTVGVLRATERPVPVDESSRHHDDGERPPLVEAAAPGMVSEEQRMALVDALLKRGAAVDATDRYGYTALMSAASRGDVVLVRRLIEAGASVNTRAGDGRTALMLAAESLGERTETVRALVNADADRTIRDNDGQTAADKVRTSQDAELLSLLE
jgi:hypothetical protein